MYRLLYWIFLFFCLDAKETKDQGKNPDPSIPQDYRDAFFPGLRTKTPIIWNVFICFVVSGARRYFLIWLAPKGTMFRLVSAYSKKSLSVRRNPPSQCYGRQARCWKSQLSKDDDNYGIKHRTFFSKTDSKEFKNQQQGDKFSLQYLRPYFLR